jgi:hypothetical protein
MKFRVPPVKPSAFRAELGRGRAALAVFSIRSDNRAAMRRTHVLPGLALVFTVAGAPQAAQYPPPVPGGPPAEARFTIKVEKGFIDDPMALDAESGALAVLLTDAASFARIDIIDLTSGKPRRSISVRDPQRQFERIAFAPGGKGVVLVSRDAGSGRRSAQYFDAQGRAARLIGPVTDFGISSEKETPYLVAWTRTPQGKSEVFSVARHRLDGLDKIGPSSSYVVNKAREMQKPSLRSVDWQNNYTEIIGLRPGEYDKQKDIRLPDRAAVLDATTGKWKWQAEIGDVYAWAAANDLRRKLPGRSLFPVFSPDTTIFDLVDFQGRRGALELPVPLRYYDATTMQDRQLPGSGALLFSLAIDPLHPEALARRKKDPSYLDLYWVPPDAAQAQGAAGQGTLKPKVERLLRAPMDDRPATWVAAGSYAAVLRKHKSFSRGGGQLEVYSLERALPD